MRIRVTSRHVDVDAALKAYIEEKISRLAHYFDRVDEAHVVLEAEGHRRIADVTVHASRAVISSEQSAEDLRSAFDRAFEKVERQIRRHKGRVRDRKHGEPMSEVAEFVGGAALGHVGIVPDELANRPMTTEEAFRELDELDARFLVFWNSESRQVNVIYRRDDGDYGLVEPEA
jgi:putative sigma-54 modulation protein